MVGAHAVTGWRCAVCGATVELDEPAPWRCPRATPTDRHHVLFAVSDASVANGVRARDDAAAAGGSAFERHDARLAWAASAAARGMDDTARSTLVADLDARIVAVAGVGFHDTPFARSDVLSELLGFADGGGVWVKDETGDVAGSHKARHLFSILLQLLATERLGAPSPADRAPLAIASCGNAALAASTLAAAAGWPIDVYVPTWMSDGFGDRLDQLGARVHRCERRSTDPPGDPAMLRFREAVASGAVPFTVQGPENALCLDGGRTIGWELAEQSVERGVDLDALVVQVGGGAFAACASRGMGELGSSVPLVAVQAEGCAPLAKAWRRGATRDSDWSEVMTPWPDPSSLADGILDDETYDWIAVVDELRATGGRVVVAAEERIRRAWDLAGAAGFDASATGSAGLAGLLELLDGPDGDEWRRRSVAVVMSGVSR